MPANLIAQGALLTSLLLYIAIKDCKTREISPKLCACISLLWFLNFELSNLLGLGIPLILWLTTAYIVPDKLGGGDIKLCAAVSIVIGFNPTTYGILIAFSIMSLVWLVMSFFKSKQEVASFSLPLAPFLTAGFLTTYYMNLGGLIS